MNTLPNNRTCIMHNSKTKVLFIQPVFAHYRYPLFDMLHKNHEAYNLIVAHDDGRKHEV